MSDRAIAFVADEKFLPHVLSIAVNCRREGGHDGDFLLIHPYDLAPVVALEGGSPIDFRCRDGFSTMGVRDRGFLQKFYLFHPALRRWNGVLYLDCDCMVQGPLSQVWAQLDAAGTLADGNQPILGDREEMPAFQSWQVWDADHRAHGLEIVRNPDTSLSPILTDGSLYARIAGRFPHVVSDRMWNTSMMCWRPAAIPEDTVDRLRSLQAEFGECNDPAKGGTDQQMIDLLLHERFSLMPRKLFCYWGLDFPNARVPSAGRGWDGTEVPAVVHYARWYSPWTVKAPNAHAYANDRIGGGVVCHEFYRRNVADFETLFPRG